jgi:hypothetical protein
MEVSEALVKGVTLNNTASISFSESLVYRASINLTDGVSITEELSRVILCYLSFSDILTIAETIQKGMSVFNSESVSLAESKVALVGKNLTATQEIVEQINTGIGYTTMLAEAQMLSTTAEFAEQIKEIEADVLKTSAEYTDIMSEAEVQVLRSTEEDWL